MGLMSCLPRGHRGNRWHRGKPTSPAFSPASHPPSLFISPNILLKIISLVSHRPFFAPTYPAVRAHFSLDRKTGILKCLLYRNLAISGCLEMAGGGEETGDMLFLPRKKQLNMLVFIQAHIPALHPKSKHHSTKNLERGNETTALTSTNHAWKMLTAEHQEQHEN